MESLKRALENIGRMWANLNFTQRIVIGGAAVLMVVLLIVSSLGTSQEWVRVAGSEADRSAVLKKLQERNQKHELRGNEIFVPKEDAERVIMDLAGEGTVGADSMSKVLEQTNLWDSRWDKEKKLQLALQSRLETMIRSIESIRNARVWINPGSTNHQLGFAGPKPSASVQVELKPDRSLSRQNIQAIAGLVARAVAGVEEDLVHIMDTKGISYRAVKTTEGSEFVGTLWEMEQAKEKRILSDIKESFALFSDARVVVRIQSNNVTRKKESVTHERPTVIKSTESTRTVRKGVEAPSGVRKGDDNPAVETPAGVSETQRESHEESVTNTQKVVEDTPAGDIQRITVGVLIPVEEGPRLAEAQKQLPELRQFVRVAAGPQARTEDISVQLIPRPVTPMPQVEETVAAFAWLAAHWTKLALGLLAVVAVWMVVRVINRSSAQDTVEELQALTTALTETREAAAELGGAAESELVRLRQGIQEMAGRNPQAVAASLKSFMTGR